MNETANSWITKATSKFKFTCWQTVSKVSSRASLFHSEGNFRARLSPAERGATCSLTIRAFQKINLNWPVHTNAFSFAYTKLGIQNADKKKRFLKKLLEEDTFERHRSINLMWAGENKDLWRRKPFVIVLVWAKDKNRFHLFGQLLLKLRKTIRKRLYVWKYFSTFTSNWRRRSTFETHSCGQGQRTASY